MIESYDNAKEELKRIDHLIYVTLKYTRTVDVLLSVVERMVNSYEFIIEALIIKAKDEGTLPEDVNNPIAKANFVLKTYSSAVLTRNIKKYLMFSFAGSFGGFDQLRLRFGSGGSIDTGTNYNWRSGKNGSYSGSAGVDTIEIMTTNSGGNNDFFVSGFMQLNAPSDGTGTADTRIGNLTTTQNDTGAFANIQTSFEWDNSTTPMTDIRFYANGGNDISGTLNIWESQD